MAADPGHEWTARELAERLQITHHSMRTQLAERARLGLVTRITTGRYTLNTPTPPTSSTRPRDH
ncbi:MAG: hypothetical protein QOG20_6909 [Pseudonocardiales bacterium]|jgi:Mn-dependent DtxR family transcriptional regulator|nr:hypothetical protein [Pseudonocardiales bacterium]